MTVLVGDIGGTHARFALAREHAGGQIEVFNAHTLRTLDHPDLPSALRDYMDRIGEVSLDAAAMCAAGPINGHDGQAEIRMTNCPWRVAAADIAAVSKAPSRVFNDFSAVALGLPRLAPSASRVVQSGVPDPRAPIAVLGPGTGLGVSALIPCQGHWLPITGEGGHVSLAPGDERELAMIRLLMAEFGHVSAERVLSGPGLETLYGVLAALDSDSDLVLPTAAEIAASVDSDPRAAETVRRFCGLLGSVAGDLVLTLGARGGVYLAGGILAQWDEIFDLTTFCRRFAAKGRFKDYLSNIPIWRVTGANPALLGLAGEALQGFD